MGQKVDKLLRAFFDGRPVDREDLQRLEYLGYLAPSLQAPTAFRLTTLGWARLAVAKERSAS